MSISRPAYTTAGSGGVFEESGNYGAQPAAAEPTGYGDNASEGPLVQPSYGNQGPGGLEGQTEPAKRPWLKWLIIAAILIIIILAVVLGAVLGTRHRGSSAYQNNGVPQEGNTSPIPVSGTSSLPIITSSIGPSPTDSSATASGPSTTGTVSDSLSSSGITVTGGPSTTAYPGGSSSSGYTDYGSSGVVSPSGSVVYGGSTTRHGPSGTRTDGLCTSWLTPRPTTTRGYGYGKLERRHYTLVPCY
ncbi:hypothetical protein FS837_000865 [Tulasnella sp. UAMH 9824]|nr:hypothetical protein FS837_000865 [Tulasnella sp. UAMH 9824]